jgi:hypothetical protein
LSSLENVKSKGAHSSGFKILLSLDVYFLLFESKIKYKSSTLFLM